MELSERCQGCPYVASQNAQIARLETDIQSSIDRGFQTIDEQHVDKIDAIAEAIVIDRIQEIRGVQDGDPIVPHEQTALFRHLQTIPDIATKKKVLSRYYEYTNGIFDVEATIDDEKVLREIYEGMDTASLLDRFVELSNAKGKLDSTRTEHREAILRVVETSQNLINIEQSRMQHAIERCENGPRIGRRYGLFGRQVLRCGSKLRYARSAYSEIPESTEK